MLPRRMAIERVAGDVEADVVGQRHRKLVLGHRHRAAGRAMDDRARSAPIALAAHAPVAQAIDARTPAPAFAFGAGEHGALGLSNGQPNEKAGNTQAAGAGRGPSPPLTPPPLARPR